jgi:hypothetical protein
MKKAVGYFHIVLHLEKLTLDEEVTLAMGIKLNGDPDATNPPFTQAQLQALAATVQTDLGGNVTGRTKTLTAKQQQDVDALTRAIKADAGYVETVANAKANGNRSIFEQVVTRIGFAAQDSAEVHPRVFESLKSDPGSFHVRVPSEGEHGITYVFRYGITTASGVLPTTWQPNIPLSVVDLIVTGIPSGSIVAVEYAVVQHPPHSTAKSPKAAPATTNKAVNVPPVNKQGKVTLVHGTTFLQFSDAIYIVTP